MQLGFVGSSQYPLWSLTMMALNILVLYTLIVRWDEGAETPQAPGRDTILID